MSTGRRPSRTLCTDSYYTSGEHGFAATIGSTRYQEELLHMPPIAASRSGLELKLLRDTSGNLGHGTALHSARREKTLGQSASAPCLPKLGAPAPRLRADPNKVWRSSADVANTTSRMELPPLAKGMSRHRCPRGTFHAPPTKPAVVSAQLDSRRQHVAHLRALGSKILGNTPWPRAVFQAVDGSSDGYISPAEFGSLVARFSAGIADAERTFNFSFDEADSNLSGRLSLSEWEIYTEKMEKAFGSKRCLAAAWQFLGHRAADPRRLIKNIWMVEGYNYDSSVQLLTACSKWDTDCLFDLVTCALDRKADPNAAITDPRFNCYTPLIFLSMAQSTACGDQVEAAIEAVIAAGGDVHRESGHMPFGTLTPLRFAAQLQNDGSLRALLRHVHVGDLFNWAAGEHYEKVMVEEMQKVASYKTVQQSIRLSKYNTQASILMLMFASPIVGGRLTPLGAHKLIAGEFEDGNLQQGARADPNAPGLDGTTALMEVVMQGDTETAKALIAERASPLQQDSEGATPLHFAALNMDLSMTKVLLEAKANPGMVDHCGFSAWMLVGESRLGRQDFGQNILVGQMFELLQPRRTAEEILHIALEDWTELIDDAKGADPEELAKTLRLHESLFFDPLTVATCTSQGRAPRHRLLDSFADLIIDLLKTDPLQGEQKKFTKYLLEATMGPRYNTSCKHVSVNWSEADNRVAYRDRLTEANDSVLDGFADECNALREAIRTVAQLNVRSACNSLSALKADAVSIPESWRKNSSYWQSVQDRQLLRYDPAWALEIDCGARCCIALLRLGAVADLSEYSALSYVFHKPAEELLAQGYVAYSELCNAPFQERMCQIARRAVKRYSLNVTFPREIIGVKRLKRLIEKTREARTESGTLKWPGRSDQYLGISNCFYILDTVRLTFICRGDSIEEEAACCFKLFKEFQKCTVEHDQACMLRQKSGFAKGIKSTGGYADVKMLVYADLGFHEAFDGTKVPLQIIGEVQLILEGYAKVKNRMHLAYEVARGSFDHETYGSTMASLDAT